MESQNQEYAGFWIRVGNDKREQGSHAKLAGTVVPRITRSEPEKFEY